MAWFYDKTVEIVNTEGGMIDGIFVNQKKEKRISIDCDVQPLGNEKIYDDTGALIQAEYQIFCDPNKNIHTHSKVIYKEKEYKISKITDWDDYYIVYIQGVA